MTELFEIKRCINIVNDFHKTIQFNKCLKYEK